MRAVVRGSGPIGRAKGASQKPVKAGPAGTPSSPDETGAECMGASSNGPRTAEAKARSIAAHTEARPTVQGPRGKGSIY